MNYPHNPYAAPASDDPAGPPTPVPTEVSALAAVKWSFSGVGFGNLALGLLLLLIPMVGGILLMGWHAETHRRLALRVGPAVPKFRFSEFGNYLMAGLPAFAVQMAVAFIVSLPLALVAGVGGAVVAMSGNTGVLAAGLGITVLLVMVVSFVVGIVVIPMQTRAELTGSIKQAFNVSASWAFAKRHFWAILGHHIVLSLIAIPLMIAGMLAVFIGMYFVVIALQFASMHLRWQLYERDVATGGEPLQIRTTPGADL